MAYRAYRVYQFMQERLETHWQLRYLAGTLDTGMTLRPRSSSKLILEGFCDANLASSTDDRRSTSGFSIYLGPNLVSWQSEK